MHTNKYEEIVNGLKLNNFKNITFITGAGISTSAGIPDFRSPTGIFQKVKDKYGLNRPEELFLIDTFLQNPKPYYDFCKTNYESNQDPLPTKTHLFQAFLCKKGLINQIYTQNVDGLELKAGVPREKIVFAHGVLSEVGCPLCHENYDINEFKQLILKDQIMQCKKCNGYIKQNCIFYGENLPKEFFDKKELILKSDLCFIMGTSLVVYPFAGLAYHLPFDSWRVLANMEQVGNEADFFINPNGFAFENADKMDLFLRGKCDETIMKLVKDVGWEDEFNAFCEERLKALNNGN